MNLTPVEAILVVASVVSFVYGIYHFIKEVNK